MPLSDVYSLAKSSFFVVIVQEGTSQESEDLVDVHCICGMPEREPMACCDQCNIWYHKNCLQIPEEVFMYEDVPWMCGKC